MIGTRIAANWTARTRRLITARIPLVPPRRSRKSVIRAVSIARITSGPSTATAIEPVSTAGPPIAAALVGLMKIVETPIPTVAGGEDRADDQPDPADGDRRYRGLGQRLDRLDPRRPSGGEADRQAEDHQRE